jgi:4-carboxymuconolactone decarboxylase
VTTSHTSQPHPTDAGNLGHEVDQARFDRGAAILATVDGKGGQRVVDALSDVAPALARHVVAHGFGEVIDGPEVTVS